MQELQQATPNSILAIFDTTSEQRASFVAGIVNEIEEGTANPLEIHARLKCVEGIIDMLTNTDEKKNKHAGIAKRYKAALLDAAQQHGKAFEFRNGKFEVKEVGVKYDYSQCGDPIINQLLEQQEQLKKKVAERSKYLQNIPEEGLTMMDEDSGEVTKIYRPSKTSTTSVAVTLR